MEDAAHGGCTTKSVFFSSLSIPNKELYCSKNVITEGPPEHFFSNKADPANDGDDPIEEEVEIDRVVFHAGNRNEDIYFVRNQGLAVNDDNEPAP